MEPEPKPKPKINPYYASLVPKMPQKDFEQLKQNIKDDGLHYPVRVNQNYVLLDGHHRVRALQELQIPLSPDKIKVMHFDDPLKEKEFVIRINVHRRHLEDYQKVELARELEN